MENTDLIISNLKYGVEPAFTFWASIKPNNHANNLDVKAVTQKINGGLNGYNDRRNRYNNIANILGIDND